MKVSSTDPYAPRPSLLLAAMYAVGALALTVFATTLYSDWRYVTFIVHLVFIWSAFAIGFPSKSRMLGWFIIFIVVSFVLGIFTQEIAIRWPLQGQSIMVTSLALALVAMIEGKMRWNRWIGIALFVTGISWIAGIWILTMAFYWLTGAIFFVTIFQPIRFKTTNRRMFVIYNALTILLGSIGFATSTLIPANYHFWGILGVSAYALCYSAHYGWWKVENRPRSKPVDDFYHKDIIEKD